MLMFELKTLLKPSIIAWPCNGLSWSQCDLLVLTLCVELRGAWSHATTIIMFIMFLIQT